MWRIAKGLFLGLGAPLRGLFFKDRDERMSTQEFEARFQSAAVAIGERKRAAKRADKLLGDGKAKPGAAGFAIARSLDAIKRQEYRLQMLVGNTGTAVRYGDRDAVRPLRIDGDFDVVAEFQPVIDQVDHDAAQGLRVRENRHPAFSGKAKRFSGVGIVADQAVDKGMQVGLTALLADVVAPAGQRKTLLDQRLHFLQVALQLFLGVAVTQEISAQPHARDRSLKTARYPRQDLDPFRSLPGNASLHGVERGGGARDFLRTILRQRLTAQIRTQAVARVLEARQRL